jgi:hypothetical protein
VGAAWTLLGKLAQRKELPLHGLKIDFGMPAGEGPALVLGTPDRLGAALLEDAPIRPEETGRISYPVVAAREEGEGSLGMLEQWYRKLSRVFTEEPVQPGTESAQMTVQHGGLGRYAMMMQFRSAAAGAQTATVVTAADGETLAAGVSRLVQPELWNRLEGDTSFWLEEPESMIAHKLSEEYQLGELPPWWQASFYFSQNPWVLLGGVLVAALVLTWLGRRLLRGFRRRHRPGVNLEDASYDP